MKPFNLEEALDGKPVVTRDSRKVTHITRIPNNNFIVGIIEDVKQIPQWALNGKFLNDHYTHPCDLFMFIEKKSVWANVYESINDGILFLMTYSSKEEASKSKHLGIYIKTIEITNEI
jgi:hypothetical protein